jgi:imidazolonepropionase-like amidohydrolase
MTRTELRAPTDEGEPAQGSADERYVITADRVFDGRQLLEEHAVVISGDQIEAVAPVEHVHDVDQRIDVAGTLLPGFIDLHGHILFDGTPREKILCHGITTVRDTGGPLTPPTGGDGRLRVLGAGPILTAPGGYPVPVFGTTDIGLEVPDAETARAAVRRLADGGAALIKVALEPGGSPGAPWSAHEVGSPPPWPMPSLDVVRAIVGEAHAHGLIVAAHLSGPEGAALALDAGVDEWAHVPCDLLPQDLIARAAKAGVRVVGTLDTLSRCAGVMPNAYGLVKTGIRLLYGTDLAHPDVPWGIDAFELQLMLHVADGVLTPLDVLSAATARAGAHLGLAPLGQLIDGAPADLIAVQGDPLQRFKLLEYPDLVVSGGRVIVGPAGR